MPKQLVFLGFENGFQEQILSALLAGCGMQPENLASNALQDRLALSPVPKLVLVDLGYLQERGLSAIQTAETLRQRNPGCLFVLQHSQTWVLSAAEQIWGTQQGAALFLPCLHPRRLESSVFPVGEQLAKLLNTEFSMELARRFLNARKSSERFSLTSLGQALELNALEKLDRRQLGIEGLYAFVKSAQGFKVQDRTWHFKKFPQVFRGDEAVKCLAAALQVSSERAADIGDLLRRCRLIEHVTKDHSFQDGPNFYRFTDNTEAIEIARDPLVLSKVMGERGFDLEDRTYLGKVYPLSLVGSEAVTTISKLYQCSRQTATHIGQLLQDLGYLSHVTMQHEFKDAPYFYELKGLKKRTNEAIPA